jgi:hemerythrin superfamily protein
VVHDAQRLPAEASTTGSGDPLDELEREHRLVEQLFARASLVRGDARFALLGSIVEALTAHTAVEEDAVYPAISATLAGGDVLVERHRAEHKEIDGLLDRIERAKADDASLQSQLRELQMAVQAHVAVEEGELFPAYRAIASPDDIRELAESVAATRKRTPARSA